MFTNNTTNNPLVTARNANIQSHQSNTEQLRQEQIRQSKSDFIKQAKSDSISLFTLKFTNFLTTLICNLINDLISFISLYLNQLMHNLSGLRPIISNNSTIQYLTSVSTSLYLS